MFTFIDLFAGIGGTRIAFKKAGGLCVFASEWDKHCQVTYEANFGAKPQGDIKQIDENDIPDHDILLAGFPCQPFSIAGVSKNLSLGRKHGFDHEKQGNLFFDIARIVNKKKPEAFLLENVKNLKSHDKGRTFKIIKNTLENGDKVFAEIHDARFYVPQHRERIIIAGFRKDSYPAIDFRFPEPPKKNNPKIADILERNVPDKYTLSDKLWQYLKNYAAKHKAKGNGFGYSLVDPRKDTITRTLSARYYKDGSEILIKQKGRNPRRLTPRECARLMGFDDSFKIPVSDTQAYKQFGNALCVPLVSVIAKQMIKTMEGYKMKKRYGQTDKKTAKPEHVKDQGYRYAARIEIEKIPA